MLRAGRARRKCFCVKRLCQIFRATRAGVLGERIPIPDRAPSGNLPFGNYAPYIAQTPDLP